MLGILGFIKDIFSPAAKLIDDLHTSGEETMEFEKVMFKMEQEMTLRMMDYESQLLTAQTNIISAEANGASWIQRNWRPMTMLTFLGLVVLDTFQWLPSPLAKEAWTMLQLGLGGYVVGRSGEKIAKAMKT